MLFGTKLMLALSTTALIVATINTDSRSLYINGTQPAISASANTDYLKAYNWGPGGPVDDLNRSTGALQYNKKFGKYDAYFIGQNEKKLFLTFDEGYEYGLTEKFLDVLKQKDVKAAFFITYDFAKAEPDLVQRMINDGHIVGNHSKTHRNFSTLTSSQIMEDINFLQDFVEKNHNYKMKYFRAPSGNFNIQTLETTQKMGLKNVFWSFAHKDWLTDRQPEPKQALEKLKKGICPGNIYLLHAVSETNLKILPELIDYAKEQGYQWETLDNLRLDS